MVRLGDARHHHWRDPMQFLFFAMGVVGRSAMLFMRVAGVAFVCLGMSKCIVARSFVLVVVMLSDARYPLTLSQCVCASLTALIFVVGCVFAYAIIPLMAETPLQVRRE